MAGAAVAARWQCCRAPAPANAEGTGPGPGPVLGPRGSSPRGVPGLCPYQNVSSVPSVPRLTAPHSIGSELNLRRKGLRFPKTVVEK